jgi:type IV pilus assembly protein PilM
VLGALIEGSGLQDLSASSCIDDLEVKMLNFQLPPLPEAEIAQILANEVESKTGEQASSLSVDYIISARTPRSVDGGLEHHTFITRKDSMLKQVALLASAALVPVSLESSIQATIEGLRFNGYLEPATASVVVDIGEAHITLALILDGELVQMTSGKLGTGAINERLMQNFSCTYLESEERKLAYQLEQSEIPSIDPATKIIEEGYYQIIVHIHDTINYYKASYKDQTISTVILTGGGAQKKGLDQALEQTIGLPVIKADALRNLEIFANRDLEEQERLPALSPFFHTAIGLALRGV